MEKCNEYCVPLCDFCQHYDFNGDSKNRYTGDGFCNLHKTSRDPDEECNKFFCTSCDEKGE